MSQQASFGQTFRARWPRPTAASSAARSPTKAPPILHRLACDPEGPLSRESTGVLPPSYAAAQRALERAAGPSSPFPDQLEESRHEPATCRGSRRSRSRAGKSSDFAAAPSLSGAWKRGVEITGPSGSATAPVKGLNQAKEQVGSASPTYFTAQRRPRRLSNGERMFPVHHGQLHNAREGRLPCSSCHFHGLSRTSTVSICNATGSSPTCW